MLLFNNCNKLLANNNQNKVKEKTIFVNKTVLTEEDSTTQSNDIQMPELTVNLFEVFLLKIIDTIFTQNRQLRHRMTQKYMSRKTVVTTIKTLRYG